MGLFSKRKSSGDKNLAVPSAQVQASKSSSSGSGSEFSQRGSASSHSSTETPVKTSSNSKAPPIAPVRVQKALPPLLRPNIGPDQAPGSGGAEMHGKSRPERKAPLDEKPLPPTKGVVKGHRRQPSSPRLTSQGFARHEHTMSNSSLGQNSYSPRIKSNLSSPTTRDIPEEGSPQGRQLQVYEAPNMSQAQGLDYQQSMAQPYGTLNYTTQNAPVPTPMYSYGADPAFPGMPAQLGYGYYNPANLQYLQPQSRPAAPQYPLQGRQLSVRAVNTNQQLSKPIENHGNGNDSGEGSSEESSGEYSESDVSESNDSYASSSAADPRQQHPYYEQWKMYFAYLAQQQQAAQADPSAANRHSMYPGAAHQYQYQNPVPNHSMPPVKQAMYAPPQGFNQASHSRTPSALHLARQHHDPNYNNNDFMLKYNQNRMNVNKEDNLVAQSRKSTIKSNRYPSVPLSILREEGGGIEKLAGNRVVSLDSNFKPNESTSDFSKERGRFKKNAQNDQGTIPYAVQAMVEPSPGDSDKSQISDYSRFLFDDSTDTVDENPDRKIKDHAIDNKPISNSSDVVKGESQVQGDDGSDTGSESSAGSMQLELEQLHVKSPTEKDLKSESMDTSFKKASKSKGKYTDPTTSSNALKDGTSARERARNSRGSSTPDFYEYAMQQKVPFSPILSPFGSSDGMPDSIYSPPNMGYPPMMNYSTENSGSSASFSTPKRQSMATPDLKRQSMMAAASGMLYGGQTQISNDRLVQTRGMLPNLRPPSRIRDKVLRKKIELLIELRKVIASGNKTLEYRLKWAKELIHATNYCLYAYVNIKGEETPPELSQTNKALFIKSSVNHLSKLLKELDHTKNKDGIFSEACYLYGCLLKHEYQITYNQDFGIDKSIPDAITYLEKSLELNPNNFKSMYALGDLYEYELDDQFDLALENYKLAAKIGYSKAILKVALLHLHVPEMRSTKFFTYLVGLTNIDLNSKDIVLSEEDREELEETVGLAAFELGKVYEGIYPGDLTAEDEFVTKSIERAPVNYAKSLTYYNKSARLECALAQVKLGQVYEYGELNRRQNPNKSIQWYMKAATSPLPFKRAPEAMLGLSRWSLIGSNGLCKYIRSPNPERAVLWCDRAIKEFNSPDAYFAMGELAEKGVALGSPEEWFAKAEELGHPEASSKLI